MDPTSLSTAHVASGQLGRPPSWLGSKAGEGCEATIQDTPGPAEALGRLRSPPPNIKTRRRALLAPKEGHLPSPILSASKA
jgi:hypothetical protein